MKKPEKARSRRMMQPCDTVAAQYAAHNRPRDREDFTEEGCKLNIGFIGAGKAGMSLGKYFAVRQQDALQNERGSHAAAANADADSSINAAHQFERIRYDARNTK